MVHSPPLRPKRVYRIPQPTATLEAGETVLQLAALPCGAYGGIAAATATSRQPRRGTAAASLLTSRRTISSVPAHGTPIDTPELGEPMDALAFLQTLDTTRLTDAEVETMTYPYSANLYTWDEVYIALQARLRETTGAIGWNHPRARPGWDTDLRFLGGWWLTLLDPSSAAARLARVGMRVVDTSAPLTMLKPRRGEVNRPLILPEERSRAAEDQLVADLALRMQGRLFRLDVLHVDELPLTPDRVQVLMFGGVVKARRREAERLAASAMAATGAGPARPTSLNDSGAPSPRPQRGALPPLVFMDTEEAPGGADADAMDSVRTQFLLETVSLSACSVGTASALVLLAALAAAAEGGSASGCSGDHPGQRETSTGAVSRDPATSGAPGVSSPCAAPRVARMTPIVNLDLSYNTLTYASLYCLTMLLPRTEVRRLSLRGNALTGGDMATTRDFLLEGCRLLEELDLSHTKLSVQQICILIEVLPKMGHLHVLNLDGLNIPSVKTSALSRAVAQSQLWSISLNGCAACTGSAFQRFIQAACEKNRARAMGLGDGAHLVHSPGFFDGFFSSPLLKGWVPPDTHALPDGYGRFTNNDPSLFA